MANHSAEAGAERQLRGRSGWQARITRARALAITHFEAAGPLTFLAHLIDLQQSVAHEHGTAVHHEGSFAASLDVEAAADAVPFFLAGLTRVAPPVVGAAAAEILQESHAQWRHRVHTFWSGAREGEPVESFVTEALLQPFAEVAAASIESFPAPHGDRRLDSCPVCLDHAVVAVLRDAAHGARRSLLCGFCLTEWPAPRLVCPRCGEEAFERLAVHRADEFPGVRIDACESCRTYVKTIDRTADATAIPVVDDIATVTLDLWAREQGYRRLRPNLLRL
jgi:formate dehydrogenase accessory protein FdhE